MSSAGSVPQFHLYGEETDEQAFDFIHAETLAARSRQYDWYIAPHSHRYLHQITYVEEGGGKLTVETNEITFGSATVIVLAPTIVHSFEFHKNTKGIVISFTDDLVRGLGDTSASLSDRLSALENGTVLQLGDPDFNARIRKLTGDILREQDIGRDGAHLAMQAYLTLAIISMSRRGVEAVMPRRAGLGAQDETVAKLRQLIEDNFRKTRNLTAYAGWMAMTPDRLNEHCKKAAGVTAGHLIRQRLLVEAKRQLIFTQQSVSEIAYSLSFSDPSYFSRFFRKYSGQTPQQFREGRR